MTAILFQKMANINVGALSTALVTAIQQAANHLAMSTQTASATTATTIVTQPSSIAPMTAMASGGVDIYYFSS